MSSLGSPDEHREADLLLELADPPPRVGQQLAQLLVVLALGEQLLGAGGVVLSVPPVRGERRRRLEPAVGAADLGVAAAVADHGRV